LHVVVAQVVVRAALLRTDEVLELHQIPQEEHRGVVADDVEVALRGVEPQRETARVTPGVWAAPLTGHRRKPDQGFSLHPGLEHRSAGEPADIGGHLEVAEGTRSLGVGLTLGDTLPVEVGHLLNQIVVLQQDGAVRTDGQRMLVTGDRDTGIGCRRPGLCVGHGFLSELYWSVPVRDSLPCYLSPGLRATKAAPAAMPPMSWAST